MHLRRRSHQFLFRHSFVVVGFDLLIVGGVLTLEIGKIITLDPAAGSVLHKPFALRPSRHADVQLFEVFAAQESLRFSRTIASLIAAIFQKVSMTGELVPAPTSGTQSGTSSLRCGQHSCQS